MLQILQMIEPTLMYANQGQGQITPNRYKARAVFLHAEKQLRVGLFFYLLLMKHLSAALVYRIGILLLVYEIDELFHAA